MPAVHDRRARLHSLIAAQLAPRSGSHAITTLEAWNVRMPSGKSSWALIRLATREGLEGWGESPPLTSQAVKRLRDAVVGSPASAYESLRIKLGQAEGAAAVNVASLDILGKAAKAPVYQLLGGPTRFKVRAYTTLAGDTDEQLLSDMSRCRAAGFKAFGAALTVPPFRNSGKAFTVALTQRMNALRKAGGEDVDFILHGDQKLTPGDAQSAADALERFHLMWFDEPCGTGSVGALRKIADENVTPLGFGRGVSDPAVFQNLLRDDAIDVLRPDIGLHGISGIRRIAALAETYYVAVAPRHDLGPVTTAAALHLAASMPNFVIQHIPSPASAEDKQMRAAIAPEAVTDGFAPLSNTPGLGVTVRREAIQKFAEVIA